jgi:hypothetical protein
MFKNKSVYVLSIWSPYTHKKAITCRNFYYLRRLFDNLISISAVLAGILVIPSHYGEKAVRWLPLLMLRSSIVESRALEGWKATCQPHPSWRRATLTEKGRSRREKGAKHGLLKKKLRVLSLTYGLDKNKNIKRTARNHTILVTEVVHIIIGAWLYN